MGGELLSTFVHCSSFDRRTRRLYTSAASRQHFPAARSPAPLRLFPSAPSVRHGRRSRRDARDLRLHIAHSCADVGRQEPIQSVPPLQDDLQRVQGATEVASLPIMWPHALLELHGEVPHPADLRDQREEGADARLHSVSRLLPGAKGARAASHRGPAADEACRTEQQGPGGGRVGFRRAPVTVRRRAERHRDRTAAVGRPDQVRRVRQVPQEGRTPAQLSNVWTPVLRWSAA